MIHIVCMGRNLERQVLQAPLVPLLALKGDYGVVVSQSRSLHRLACIL